MGVSAWRLADAGDRAWVCIHVCRANVGPSGAPGSRARPGSTSSRLANSFAGDEVTIPRDVQAEEEHLPGRSHEKWDQTVEVKLGNFYVPFQSEHLKISDLSSSSSAQRGVGREKPGAAYSCSLFNQVELLLSPVDSLSCPV